MIKQYDKVKLNSGKYAIIVEVLDSGNEYIADIEISAGDYETETIKQADIAAQIVEVEKPINA